MKQKRPPFVTLTDNQGAPFLSANPLALRPPIAARLTTITPDTPGVASFVDDSLLPKRVWDGPFSAELTARDDVLMAVLVLLFILATESILAAGLLRARRGRASAFGFSVKRVVDLTRGARLRFPCGRSRTSDHVQRKGARPKVIACALAILTVSFAAEILLLVFTTPRQQPVSNEELSLQLREPVNPDWNKVRELSDDPFYPPCRDVRFRGVRTGEGRVSACMTSTKFNMANEEFEPMGGNVTVEIVSDVHDFGAVHEVFVGNCTALFIARVDFRLGDGKTRLMRHRARLINSPEIFEFVHRQVIAYLFNAYGRMSKDVSMTAARLARMSYNFTVEDGPLMDVVQLSRGEIGRFRRATSVRHRTVVTDKIPRGPKAVRMAGLVLSASSAISISGPDAHDVFLGSGNMGYRPAVVWWEEKRDLNCLSVILIVTITFAVLVVLRVSLKPISLSQTAAFVLENDASEMRMRGGRGPDSGRGSSVAPKAHKASSWDSEVAASSDSLRSFAEKKDKPPAF